MYGTLRSHSWNTIGHRCAEETLMVRCFLFFTCSGVVTLWELFTFSSLCSCSSRCSLVLRCMTKAEKVQVSKESSNQMVFFSSPPLLSSLSAESGLSLSLSLSFPISLSNQILTRFAWIGIHTWSWLFSKAFPQLFHMVSLLFITYRKFGKLLWLTTGLLSVDKQSQKVSTQFRSLDGRKRGNMEENKEIWKSTKGESINVSILQNQRSFSVRLYKRLPTITW